MTRFRWKGKTMKTPINADADHKDQNGARRKGLLVHYNFHPDGL